MSAANDPKQTLPPQQRKVLEFIGEFIDISGYPPSISEIAEYLGVSSTFGVRKHVEALIKKGFIERAGAGLSRALKVANSEKRPSAVPIVGRVQAGAPILAVENIESWLTFTGQAAPGQKLFGLRVQGDSMKDKGILEGDIIIVKQQETANDGEIIVALLDDSATVKTFRKAGTGYQLDPANDKYSPIPITPDNHFQILGKVTNVLRSLEPTPSGPFKLRYN